jgi:hypothetical protein
VGGTGFITVIQIQNDVRFEVVVMVTVTPYGLIKVTEALEECTASIFRTKV